MRVICPFTEIHPLADQALAKYAPQVERVLLKEDTSYWKLLCHMWEGQEDFVIVEHDIEIHEETIPQLESCDQPWCIFAYPGVGWRTGDLFSLSLGCVKFGRQAMVDWPELMVNNGPTSWRRLDVKVLDAMRLRGYNDHQHSPPVQHHHFYAYGCACGDNHGGSYQI